MTTRVQLAFCCTYLYLIHRFLSFAVLVYSVLSYYYFLECDTFESLNVVNEGCCCHKLIIQYSTLTVSNL